MPLIYPSLMAADPLNLGAIIAALDPYCSGYHIDIMDGHYVPNMALSPSTIKAIAHGTHHHLWVHWMVKNPLQFLAYFTLPPNSLMSFHIERNENIHECLKLSRENDFKVGITLAPKTPVNAALAFLDATIDDVLVMSVEPGFSGQKFIPETREKIKDLAAYRVKKNLTFTISVDGGIDATTLPLLVDDGADLIAIASAIFSTRHPVQALRNLQSLIKSSE